MSNVLVLCEFPVLNGGERSLLAVVPGLWTSGFRVTVAAPECGPLANELARLGVPHHPFSTRDEAGQALSRDAARGRLRGLLEELRPVILHANSLSMGRLSGPVAREVGIPSVAHLRDIIGLSSAAVADLNCHRRLVAVSQATQDYHAAKGLDAAKCVVIYNGVEGPLQAPRAARTLRAELGWPDDAIIAGTIGQIILRKGLDVLARAAAELAGDASLARLHWAIVGDRHSRKPETIEYEAQVKRTFAEAGLDRRVRFLGTRTDVPRLLAGEFDFLVHPARQEPLGRVLLESAAAGLAVLATDVGGTREIFGDEAAMLVPVGDSAALAAGMRRLALEETLRGRLGHAARVRASELFTVQRSAERLAEVYRSVMSSS